MFPPKAFVVVVVVVVLDEAISFRTETTRKQDIKVHSAKAELKHSARSPK